MIGYLLAPSVPSTTLLPPKMSAPKELWEPPAKRCQYYSLTDEAPVINARPSSLPRAAVQAPASAWTRDPLPKTHKISWT